MTDQTNYPDLLGMMTGGERLNIGVIQAALGVRPSPARVGRPFEVVLLLQNASNAPVEATVSLHLPDQDARRQKGRFAAKTARVAVTVAPAEVGYVSLPAASHPETAPGAYKLGVELDVKGVSGKPSRIRQPNGGGAVSMTTLPDKTQEILQELQRLTFSISKRMGRNIIDIPFELAANAPTLTAEVKAGWVSVCKLTDYADDRLLLHAYGTPLQVKTLPSLKRAVMFEPLVEATRARFGASGFKLEESEAKAIAKLLTIILEYAAPKNTGHGYVNADVYAITPLLERDPLTIERPLILPHWCRAMLRLIARDERTAAYPTQAIPRLIYDDLLRDAIEYGFELVETATGENLGSAEEMMHYCDHLIDLLKAGQPDLGLNFNRVYLPLIMGGILVNDRLLMEREDPAELLKASSHTLEARIAQLPDADPTIHEMTSLLIERTGQKYGYRLN